MSQRKFHRYVFQWEVLSEEPLFENMNPEELHHKIIYEQCSGQQLETQHEEIDGERAAKLLMGQGSDPEFFGLDEDGNDVDDDVEITMEFMETLRVYYQPHIKGTNQIPADLTTFEVYIKEENARLDYPDCDIVELQVGTIENPTFVDLIDMQ